MDGEKRAEVVCYLRNQVDAINKAIKMVEQHQSCMEVIKQLQLVQVSLHTINFQLLNDHLGSCVANVTRGDSDPTPTLDELSVMFGFADRL